MSNVDSEEEDYMSDTFLAKCADTRPGLLSKNESHQNHKQAAQKKSKENNMKPRKVLEKEQLELGLQNKLGSDNKGFALLTKMGYKPGTSLGKRGNGRSEPIPIEVKLGRGGFGEKEERKRREKEISKMRQLMVQKRQSRQQTLLQDYRARLREQQAEREAKNNLHKCQRVCEQLDMAEEIEKPCQYFFWTKETLKTLKERKKKNAEKDEGDQPLVQNEYCFEEQTESTDEEEDSDEEANDDELLTDCDKLELLVLYLRSEYLYCIWCGTRFEDEDDMATDCPGSTFEAHDCPDSHEDENDSQGFQHKRPKISDFDDDT